MPRNDVNIAAGLNSTMIQSLAAAVQRGANGRLHIDVKKMSEKDEAEFAIWQARLNDPPVERMHQIRKVADNAPAVLSK